VKYSLPDGHTDFIFAVTVEEFGFMISMFLIVLLAGFVIRCFRNALKLNDYFSQLAVAGLATMIGMQVVINLFVNLNMAPSKGMTLPFISYLWRLLHVGALFYGGTYLVLHAQTSRSLWLWRIGF